MDIQTLIKKNNDNATTYIVQYFQDDSSFLQLSNVEACKLKKRDENDGVSLKKGINIGIKKGLLPSVKVKSKAIPIFIDNKTSVMVAQDIISHLHLDKQSGGQLITIQGLSGVGKGTTAKRLMEAIPNTVIWSNGNGFRILTLLTNAYAKRKGIPLKKVVQSKGFISALFDSITVEYTKKGYEICLDEYGVKSFVSDIVNTRLQDKEITGNVPVVARRAQGEMICFTNRCVENLRNHNLNIVIEGRKETLQYLLTENRFELQIINQKELGKRRAAQRILAEAKRLVAHGYGQASEDEILREALCKIVDKEKLSPKQPKVLDKRIVI